MSVGARLSSSSSSSPASGPCLSRLCTKHARSPVVDDKGTDGDRYGSGTAEPDAKDGSEGKRCTAAAIWFIRGLEGAVLTGEVEVEAVCVARLSRLCEGGVAGAKRALHVHDHGAAVVTPGGCDVELLGGAVQTEDHEVDASQGVAASAIQAHLHTEAVRASIHGAVWKRLWDAGAVKLDKVSVATLSVHGLQQVGAIPVPDVAQVKEL